MEPVFLLQAAAAPGVSVKDLATILGVISVFATLIGVAFKLGAFSERVETTEKNALHAVDDVRSELHKITTHIAEEAKQRVEWSGWRGGMEQRVGDVERRVTELEP